MDSDSTLVHVINAHRTPSGSVNHQFPVSHNDSGPPLELTFLLGRPTARTSNAAVAKDDGRKTFLKRLVPDSTGGTTKLEPLQTKMTR
jgi:hypothetical protein